jgi:hypothetical protein
MRLMQSSSKLRAAWALSVALAVVAMAGCGGDDDSGGEPLFDAGRVSGEPPTVAGTFVGKVEGTNAFIAVIAPPEGGEGERVTAYVSDAARLSEVLTGTAEGDEFTATTERGDGEVEGTLSAKRVTGMVELPGGERAQFEADRATGAAGLYALTVASDGGLEGASESGVALQGETPLPDIGEGSLKLADGTRLDVEVARNKGEPIALPPGEVRLIVMPGGQVRGAGQNRSADDGDDPGFFVRSASE